MSTELKLRRDTNTNLMLTTPADGEAGYDQTNKRLIVGDGAKAGGWPHANVSDIQKQTFNGGTTGGTANALTLTFATQLAPASYTAMARYCIKTALDNTAAATININGLGAKNIKKILGGVKTTLAAGDIVSGIVYDLIYDGTDFQIVSGSQGIVAGSITQTDLGADCVGQSELKSTSGEVSATTASIASNATMLALPGGAYGFWPRLRAGISGTAYCNVQLSALGSSALTSSNVAYIALGTATTGSATTIYANQTYVSASPPYDIGDGEMPLFVFAEVNPGGNIVKTYTAIDPPWAYNGPTPIRATDIIGGQKYRSVMLPTDVLNGTEESIRAAALAQARDLNGRNPNQEYAAALIPINQEWKNADMDLIPHPFSIDAGNTIVMADIGAAAMNKILTLSNDGESTADLLRNWCNIGNIAVANRAAPSGVLPVTCSFRQTRR